MLLQSSKQQGSKFETITSLVLSSSKSSCKLFVDSLEVKNRLAFENKFAFVASMIMQKIQLQSVTRLLLTAATAQFGRIDQLV